ncbi:hypothetical protein Hanom_Chr02g00176071 [Helianthus anomalus]
MYKLTLVSLSLSFYTVAKLEIFYQGRGSETYIPKNFYRTGGSKTYIPKNFYTKTTYITLLAEKFGGVGRPSRPLQSIAPVYIYRERWVKMRTNELQEP